MAAMKLDFAGGWMVNRVAESWKTCLYAPTSHFPSVLRALSPSYLSLSTLFVAGIFVFLDTRVPPRASCRLCAPAHVLGTARVWSVRVPQSDGATYKRLQRRGRLASM